MDILFVASEIAPMAKVGGLADVVAALSKAIRLLGHKVTIAMPKYAAFSSSGIMLARRLTPLTIKVLGENVDVTLYDARLGSGVELLLLDIEGLYDRHGIYGDEHGDFPDNAKRFALFSRAVVELIRQRWAAGSPFDVVHAHDWAGAMVPYLLRHEHPANIARTPTVLTIHNLAHQGLFPPQTLGLLGLGTEHFGMDRLEFYGDISFLKGGIVAADAITTVSGTYAREILTPELGERMDGVLATKAVKLSGIVNGIDYAVWNPLTDPALVARYDAEDTANKGRCKAAFLQEVGLPLAPDRPLLSCVGRIVSQKGSDLIAAALPKLLKSDVSIVIAGTGDPALCSTLAAAVAKTPDRAAYLGFASEAAVHRLFAASDLLLVPSRYEPCGLVQLYAQRYGAVPIAHRTGGLVDTIVDLDAELETGTGFLFDKPTAASLISGVQRGLAAMTSPRWPSVVRRVMRLDLGWDRPARRYANVYRAAAAR